jgi:Zn-dependent peptidase ImmA (M78 family)
MAYQRGFKTNAHDVAAQVRSELGLGPLDPLDPLALAECVTIPVIRLSSLEAEAPEVGHLLTKEVSVFSAVTVFDGPRRAIVHNDAHAQVRQNSNLCHELGHGLLRHPPTPPMDDTGCRIWNQDVEDEAAWLGGCLLVPEEAALAIARGRWTQAEAALHFGVSDLMIRYRLNATGAIKRVRRQRTYTAR